jgi:hypothetical protein
MHHHPHASYRGRRDLGKGYVSSRAAQSAAPTAKQPVAEPLRLQLQVGGTSACQHGGEHGLAPG